MNLGGPISTGVSYTSMGSSPMMRPVASPMVGASVASMPVTNLVQSPMVSSMPMQQVRVGVCNCDAQNVGLMPLPTMILVTEPVASTPCCACQMTTTSRWSPLSLTQHRGHPLSVHNSYYKNSAMVGWRVGRANAPCTCLIARTCSASSNSLSPQPSTPHPLSPPRSGNDAPAAPAGPHGNEPCTCLFARTSSARLDLTASSSDCLSPKPPHPLSGSRPCQVMSVQPVRMERVPVQQVQVQQIPVQVQQIPVQQVQLEYVPLPPPSPPPPVSPPPPPPQPITQERIIEVPVEVQKIVKVEVPVEVEKIEYVEKLVEKEVEEIEERRYEVEKIIEVPVPYEKVVTVEVPVEKIVYKDRPVPVQMSPERVVVREVPYEVEVTKEVPVPVERVVYKEVLVPVERMTAEARQEYNQYAATQGLPQYNSTMGFIVSLCVQLRCAKCRPHAPSHHDLGHGNCSEYPLLCLSNDHNIPLVPSISDSAPWKPLVRTQLVL